MGGAGYDVDGLLQEPRGPTRTSQFELSSVPATLKTLFNLTGFLTARDAWAGSASHRR
jgi:hypothetical protein